jgi:hypothetical protein
MNKIYKDVNEALQGIEALMHIAEKVDVLAWLTLCAAYAEIYCIKLKGMK